MRLVASARALGELGSAHTHSDDEAGAVVMLEARDVARYFRTQSLRGERIARAVDGVDLQIRRGEILGVAGETGSGKSTLARLLCGLLDCTRGHVLLEGRDIAAIQRHDRLFFRQQIQMVFQDPEASLNPRKRVRHILEQPLRIHHIGTRRERRGMTAELLEKVRLTPADYYLDKYPHELSGGAKQRVAIARALAPRPAVIIADEPVASLDMSIRGAILTVLRDLSRDMGITLLIISHDLNVLRAMSTRVAIMYLGKVVEVGSREAIFSEARHPYTTALLSVNPVADPSLATDRPKPILLAGEVPSAWNPPPGCRFESRCRYAVPHCRAEEPPLAGTDNGHSVACFEWERIQSTEVNKQRLPEAHATGPALHRANGPPMATEAGA
jgi:oligopeptide/dipeptide ABC transporter ATP-binding protein